MNVRTYSSPLAFKQAIEERLRSKIAKDGELARTRQLLVFDRFLARIVAVLGDAATLKGGLALALGSAGLRRRVALVLGLTAVMGLAWMAV